MKIVDLQKLWNYVVDNFLIWNHLIMQNYVWISQIWNSNFSNDFGWKNFLHENYRSRKVMKLCSWPLLIWIHLGPQTSNLLSVCWEPFSKHSAKMYFAECLCFGTRRRGILPCAFFLALDKSVFQINFWGPKQIQMKKFSTTKLYNFSRSTKFILIISSFDKATITLFIKSTSLSYLSY